MPKESSHDLRARLVQEKYFSLRPKPLERWIWQQRIPASAERVFWLHWEAGMRRRDWCSEISLQQVARECCIDVSSVTRAYQLLRSQGLIRREDPGRDPGNPFRQITPITEVRIPRALLGEIERCPSRRPVIGATSAPQPSPNSVSATEKEAVASEAASPQCWTREEMGALWARVSDAERGRHYQANRNYVGSMTFDADTKLSAEEQAFLLQGLRRVADARRREEEEDKPVRPSPYHSPQGRLRRALTPFELVRARRAIGAAGAKPQQTAELLRQVAWAVEEGALRRFETLKALNIALKKIREGQWTRPNRMPPNWRRVIAEPEVCSAA
jgi:hypothetical protein